MHTLHCPTCQKPHQYKLPKDVPYRPFCSKRCQLIDLGKWFDGEYRISRPPTSDDAPPDEPPSDTE